jgi:hypothetical protein
MRKVWARYESNITLGKVILHLLEGNFQYCIVIYIFFWCHNAYNSQNDIISRENWLWLLFYLFVCIAFQSYKQFAETYSQKLSKKLLSKILLLFYYLILLFCCLSVRITLILIERLFLKKCFLRSVLKAYKFKQFLKELSKSRSKLHLFLI